MVVINDVKLLGVTVGMELYHKSTTRCTGAQKVQSASVGSDWFGLSSNKHPFPHMQAVWDKQKLMLRTQ